MSKSSIGSIQITDAALASLIGLTAHEVPGVVGMAPVNLKEGITKALGRSQVKDGVTMHRGTPGQESKGRQAKPTSDAPYWAELSVIVAYGVSIPTVAQNIEDRVRHIVRTQAGVELQQVRVNVVGVSRE
ncbi:Asp23/Gls24 family envelope stress response protein [Deinococcus radiophilus]|uniref:Asp23/Gls24 family envelope stress response protein n=1 Tax=Deinococcus radiophilus TaxID=32062 RepID=UPI001E409A5E|nr:Asp23/Gls24 family envelope stress response protein [Deinococcus radiophilus]UFA50872.1 Asp23/Gls24 family envelope stress response protein [Deinococcus radiophilus]